ADGYAYITEKWGTEALAEFASRTAAQDPAFGHWFAKMCRAASTPREIVRMMRANNGADVRAIVPTVQAPALIIHRADFMWAPLEHGRYLADHLADARLVVIPGEEASLFVEPGVEETLREMETFLTGTPARAATRDRVLATVLYTDIVGSTERAASI